MTILIVFLGMVYVILWVAIAWGALHDLSSR